MTALAGAAITALTPFILQKLFPGKREKFEQKPKMTGEQQDLLSQIMQGMGGPMQQEFDYLSQILSDDPKALEAFQAPAMRQFHEQIIPGISERFAGIGGMSSSGLQQQLGQAGAGLSEYLMAQKAGLKQGAMSQLGSLMGTGLGARPFDSIHRASTPGMGKEMAPGVTSALVDYLLPYLAQKFQGTPKTTTPGPYGSYTPGQYDMYRDITR